MKLSSPYHNKNCDMINNNMCKSGHLLEQKMLATIEHSNKPDPIPEDGYHGSDGTLIPLVQNLSRYFISWEHHWRRTPSSLGINTEISGQAPRRLQHS